MSVEEAAELASQYDISGRGPLVIADYADNPGGGAYGDSTNLLRALLSAGMKNACLGPMVDRDAARLISACQVGSSVSVRLGGKTDPRFGGGPLDIEGTVMHVSEDGKYTGDGPMIGGLHCSFGTTAVLRCMGVDILIVSEPEQILDQQQFKAFGIDPALRSVVAVKSMQHFRAAFGPIAGEIIVCDSGALCTPDMTRLAFFKCPRPIFPIDKDFSFSAECDLIA